MGAVNALTERLQTSWHLRCLGIPSQVMDGLEVHGCALWFRQIVIRW